MSWQRRYQVRHFLQNSFWFVPALCMVFALVAGVVTRTLDEFIDIPGMRYSLAGAQGLLNGVATSLLTFLVFVITSMLLIVQISSSQLTPRIIALAFSNRPSQLTLGLFVFTYTFTLATLGRMEGRVPQLTVALAVISTVLCLIVFFWFAQRLGTSLRPVAILRTVGEETRKVVNAVYPNAFATSMNGPKKWREALAAEPARVVEYRGPSGVFLAFGERELVALASRHQCVIELLPQVGDFVSMDEVIARVYPAHTTLTDEVICETVVVGAERTLEQDPAFGLRIMVDIASRALSPAINDPTTAVLVLDQIHRVLRYVGRRQLSDGMIHDSAGRLRLVYPTPNWEDFVALAVTEIRQFGVSSIQIPRRLRAMLEHLAEVLPEARRPALRAELALLQAAVRSHYPEGEDRLRAEMGDLQGMGGVAAKVRTAA